VNVPTHKQDIKPQLRGRAKSITLRWCVIVNQLNTKGFIMPTTLEKIAPNCSDLEIQKMWEVSVRNPIAPAKTLDLLRAEMKKRKIAFTEVLNQALCLGCKKGKHSQHTPEFSYSSPGTGKGPALFQCSCQAQSCKRS
jgi:hypothetical protein